IRDRNVTGVQTCALPIFESGQHLWNAGMFVAPVRLLLRHLEVNEPELFEGVTAIAKARAAGDMHDAMAEIWPTLPKTSIDYAVEIGRASCRERVGVQGRG